jgi:hypothetical protein
MPPTPDELVRVATAANGAAGELARSLTAPDDQLLNNAEQLLRESLRLLLLARIRDDRDIPAARLHAAVNRLAKTQLLLGDAISCDATSERKSAVLTRALDELDTLRGQLANAAETLIDNTRHWNHRLAQDSTE